jgi:hypothetical protein
VLVPAQVEHNEFTAALNRKNSPTDERSREFNFPVTDIESANLPSAKSRSKLVDDDLDFGKFGHD